MTGIRFLAMLTDYWREFRTAPQNVVFKDLDGGDVWEPVGITVGEGGSTIVTMQRKNGA